MHTRPLPFSTFPAAESGDGTVRARTHTALRASQEPHHAAPAPAAVAADTQSRESFVLVLVVVRPTATGLAQPGAKTEAASPGCSRARKWVV